MSLEQGDSGRAETLLAEALVLLRELGDKQGVAEALANLGTATWARGDGVRAVALLEESLALKRDLGDRQGMAYVLGSLGTMALEQGEFARAAALLGEVITVLHQLEDRHGMAAALEGIAYVAAAQRHFDVAARLGGAAAALRDAIGAPLPPADTARHDRHLSEIQQHLGEAMFERLWSAGWSLSPTQAMAEAVALASKISIRLPSAYAVVAESSSG
jgi:tetratricopeptide (TPR) repeat protein